MKTHILILTILIILVSLIAKGQIQSQQDGNWNNTSTWAGGVIPGTGGAIGSDVIIDNNINMDIDASVGALTVNANKILTLTAKKALQITGNTVNNGSIILQANSTGAAAIIDNGTIGGGGSWTVQSYLDNHPGVHPSTCTNMNCPELNFLSAWGYHNISAPIQNATLGNLTGFLLNVWLNTNPGASCPLTSVGLESHYVTPCDVVSTIWSYDETHSTNLADALSWLTPSAISDPMTAMKGFLFLTPVPSTVNMTGVPHTGEQVITLTNSGGNGFNLIGNPYPSPVDWDEPTGWTKNTVDNALYFSHVHNGSGTQYYTYINGIGNPGGGGVSSYIPAGQGFFVHSQSSNNLVINNNARTVSPEAMGYKIYKKKNIIYPYIRFKIYDNKGVAEKDADETVIYFHPDAKNGFDGKCDAFKLLNSYPIPNLYTNMGGKKLSIAALAQMNDGAEVSMGINVHKNSDYIIKLYEKSGIPEGMHILLKDKVLDSIQDMTINPEYVFTQNKNANEERFNVYFTSITSLNYNNDERNVKIYTENHQVFIDVSGIYKKIDAEVGIYDLAGKKVFSKQVNLSSTHILTTEIAPALYIINIKSDNLNISRKILIQ